MQSNSTLVSWSKIYCWRKVSEITSIAVKLHIYEITPSDLFLLIMPVLNTLFRNCDRTQKKFLKSHKQYYNLSLSEGKKKKEKKEKMELALRLLGRAAEG